MHSGWIEFSYQDGDRIDDLSKSIDRKWGKSNPRERFGVFGQSAAWLFFCAQEDGEYLALRRQDHIPTNSPVEGLQHPRSDQHLLHEDIFDVFFLEREFWNSAEGMHGRSTPIEVTKNFSVALPFDRSYVLPDKPYDVRLLALMAIVGG